MKRFLVSKLMIVFFIIFSSCTEKPNNGELKNTENEKSHSSTDAATMAELKKSQSDGNPNLQKNYSEYEKSLVQSILDSKITKMGEMKNNIADQPTGEKIYIDSIPYGADVYLQSSNLFLGKTPLVLDSSEVPDKNFSIMVDVDYFLSQIKDIDDLKDLYNELTNQRSYPGSYFPKYFDFESNESIAFKNEEDGMLLSIGTNETMDYPYSNRVMVLFIPEGKTISALSELMLPVYTYGSFEFMKQRLIKHYNLSLIEAETIVYFLGRCGKAKIITENYPQIGHSRELIVTLQGPGNSKVIFNEKLRKKTID